MIDESHRTAVAICDLCGRREIRATRDEARGWLAGHEAHSHTSHRHAREAVRIAATRRASEMVLDRTQSV